LIKLSKIGKKFEKTMMFLRICKKGKLKEKKVKEKRELIKGLKRKEIN